MRQMQNRKGKCWGKSCQVRARLWGGDGDYGDGYKGGRVKSASIIPGSLTALHYRYPALTSALERRSTLTLIVVKLRWGLFRAMT